jgi:hypothetical protein
MKKPLLVTLLLVMLTHIALAQRTVGEVQAVCEDAIHLRSGLQADGAAANNNRCAGYISGVLDTNQLWQAAMVKIKNQEVLKRNYCLPLGLSPFDAAQVFVDWAAGNPAQKDASAANGIILALRAKYPCK